MKQVLQDLGTGAIDVVDTPCPAPAPGHVLIRTSRSLISAGTERMLLQFGKAGWIAKARQQPDKVRMVLEKIRTDGLLPTITSVRNKLAQPIAPGYCNVGTVIATGAGVTALRIGDRVASNGKHAQIVAVPENLCAAVPAIVKDEEAVFTVIGAVALQGIRLVGPTLGECVVVTGLGLVGLITVQLLRAHGCRVLGIDFDRAKLDLARRCGAEVVDLSVGEDPLVAARTFSRGRGVDAVLLTASTRSSEPVHQAATMCRKRGRIVLVGVTGLELSRADFYEKELTFQVSCSYGPGRYDTEYEQKGHDYPAAFVRWTEQRNFEAVLDMAAAGRVDFAALVSHRVSVERAAEAYDILEREASALGIVLEYPCEEEIADDVLCGRTVLVQAQGRPVAEHAPVVSFIGAGSYAQTLIPAFRSAGARLKTVVSATGVSATNAARRHGFDQASTDTTAAVADEKTDALVVCTRHDTHAALVCAALKAGKHVFVEKPLAITYEGLDAIASAHADALARGHSPLVMVGFNRRFAPHVRRMKALLGALAAPKAFVITVNAGAIPAEHWTRDPQVGGGRIVGEGCHFIDLMRFLAGSAIRAVSASAAAADPDDAAIVTLTFADGSSGTVHYLTGGHKAFPKERVEVFCAGRILQLDNFRRLSGYGWPGFRSMRLWGQDKGNAACAAAFVQAVANGGASPIAFDELLEVSRATLDAAARLRTRA